ncbi:MAG: hypothetical protein ACLSCV_12365 [Acutalibacteraceae bacterium]
MRIKTERGVAEIGKVKELSIADSMVIDIEKGFMQFGIAKELANIMDATYCVDTLRKESILQMVESVREAK